MAKKDTERRDIDRFLQIAQLPGLQPPVEEGERPDFRIRFADGRRIGLEHTRATVESIRADGAAQQRFAGAVTDSLRTANINLEVLIWFYENHNAVIERKASADSSARLVSVAQKVHQQRGLPKAIEMAELDQLGIKGIRRVDFFEADVASVSISRSAVLQGARLVETCMSDKDDKLRSYRQMEPVLDAYWLLIVSGDGFGEPRWMEGTRFLFNRTQYERVFFLDLQAETVNEFQPPVRSDSA